MDLLLAVYSLSLLLNPIMAQCSGPKTITMNADADLINQCQTYDGDIVIDTGASGDIYLNGIETITGSLTAKNAPLLTSLNADNITSIGGVLQLSNLTLLNRFGFPLLEHVQSLTWTGLPSLQGLSFDTGLTEAESISISNTSLINLSGFTPVVVGSIDVNNNAYLETINFNELENATSSLSFQANAPNTVIQFESLQFVCGNLTFRNISGLSVPDLQNVTGSFTCYSCAVATFKATWVQSVGGTLAFVSTDLQTLEFPDLTYVGGSFQISNNSQLADLSGFPMLDSVDGSMILNGVFSSVDFSALESVQGDVHIATTSSNGTICDVFNDFHTHEVIKGSINCQTSVSNSAATNSTSGIDPGTNSTNTGNSTVSLDSSSSGMSGGAIAGIVIGALALLALIGLTIFYFRHRTQKKSSPASPKVEIEVPLSYAQLPANEHEKKAEMYVDPRNVAEMRGQGRFAAEIDSGKGDVTGKGGKMIPGMFEAEGDSSLTAAESRQRSEMEALSPVSPIDGTVASGGGAGGKTCDSISAVQDGSGSGSESDRLLK